jgi:hypothetical protein
MNIFFLHTNPRKCARWHCDKHVVKMILETCQLLYTCHWMLNSSLATAPFRKGTEQRGYKKSHWNHPCAKWVRGSLLHYVWLASLGKELVREYKVRYKRRTHGCEEHMEWLFWNPPLLLKNTGWSEPAKAMPDLYKSGDSVASYRRYYINDKTRMLHYTNRHTPHWIKTHKTEASK